MKKRLASHVRKHLVSSTYCQLFSFCFILFATLLILYIVFLKGISILSDYVCIGALSIGLISSAVTFIVDPLASGRFSFNADGVTMYMPFGREYFHQWNCFREISTIGIPISQDGTNSYWVYFSNRYLTIEEQRHFLNKTRWNRTRTFPNLDSFAYFQASVEIMEELISVIPSSFADQLREEQVALGVLLHSNSRERRFNKR